MDLLKMVEELVELKEKARQTEYDLMEKLRNLFVNLQFEMKPSLPVILASFSSWKITGVPSVKSETSNSIGNLFLTAFLKAASEFSGCFSSNKPL